MLYIKLTWEYLTMVGLGYLTMSVGINGDHSEDMFCMVQCSFCMIFQGNWYRAWWKLFCLEAFLENHRFSCLIQSRGSNSFVMHLYDEAFKVFNVIIKYIRRCWKFSKSISDVFRDQPDFPYHFLTMTLVSRHCICTSEVMKKSQSCQQVLNPKSSISHDRQWIFKTNSQCF